MSAVRWAFQYRFNYGKLSNTKSIVFYWRIIWYTTRYRFVFRVIQLLLVFNFLKIFQITKFSEELSHTPLITIIFCNTQVALWNRWLCTGWVWPGEYRRVAALSNPVVETRLTLLKPQQTHTTIVSHSLTLSLSPPPPLSTHRDYDIPGEFTMIPRLLRLFPRSLNLLTVTIHYITVRTFIK